MKKLTVNQKRIVKNLKDNIINENNYFKKYKMYFTLIKYLQNNLNIKKKEYKHNIIIDYKIANSKISANDTIIFSLGSALSCYSALKGYCQLYKNKKCYALQNELQYNTSILYKNRQYKQFKRMNTFTLIRNLIRIIKKHKTIKYLRLNESGEIKSKKELKKIIAISKALKKYNVKVYTYSHNKELDYNKKHDNFVINSSHKENKKTNRFLSYTDNKINRIMNIKKSNKIVKCKADCSKCKLCTSNNQLTILCTLH